MHALDLLRCPITGERLEEADGELISRPGGRRYRIDPHGIPLFARESISEEARIQEAHYDRIARVYLDNLIYPHTEDRVPARLGTIVEVCCGAGEACWLLRDRVDRAVGVDVSTAMLAHARRRMADSRFEFVQGDACRLPLADRVADAGFLLGGIHHVNERRRLFSEAFRVLKPGGTIYFRDPLDDFFLWRLMRRVVYRLSPTLDEETERPLRRDETVQDLRAAGFQRIAWQPLGFIGFCLLMNSDVLVLNRWLRFVPGIRPFTRFMARVDDASLRVPGLQRAGVAVIGAAAKP